MTINKALFALPFIFMLFACGGKSFDSYLESGKRSLQADNSTSAIIDLKNAVREQINNGEARVLLGTAYLRNGQFEFAEKELKKASDLGISAERITPLIVENAYYQGDYDTINSTYKQATELSPQAQSTLSLYHYLVKLRTRTNQQNADLVPTDVLGEQKNIAQAYLDFANRQNDQAQSLLDNSSLNSPDKILKQELLAMLATTNGKHIIAADLYQQILGSMPYYNRIRFLLADSYIKAQDFDAAQKPVSALLALSAQNAYANYLQSIIFYQKQDYESAKKHATTALQNGFTNPLAYIIAGISAYKTASWETAYGYLITVPDEMKSRFYIDRIIAHLQLKLGYTDKSISSLNSLEQITEADANLFAQTAMQLASNGNIDQAIESLQRAREVAPNDAKIAFQQGLIQLNANDETAIQTLEDVLKIDNSITQAWPALALSYIKNNDVKNAMAVAERWMAIDPVNGLNLKALVEMFDKKYDSAIANLLEAQKLDPKHLGVKFNLSRAYLETEQIDQALAVAKDIIEQNPDNKRAIFGYARLAKDMNKQADSMQFLTKVMNKNPTLINLKIAVASILAMDKKFDEAATLLEKVRDKPEFSGWLTLGDIYIQAKKFTKAEDVFKAWKKAEPNNPAPYLRQITVLDLQGEFANAIKITQQAENIFPAYNQFVLLHLNYQLQLGDWQAAQNTLSDVTYKKIQSPVVTYYRGWLALGKGQYKEAETLLADSYAQSPNMQYAYMLAKAMQFLGRPLDGGNLLETELDKAPDNIANIMRISEYYLSNELYEQAYPHYLKLIENNNKNFVVYNNLASITSALNKPKDAEVYAKKALALSPDNPLILETLANIKLQQGNNVEALTIMEKAYRLDINNIDIKKTYIKALKANGKITEADKLMSDNLTS